MITITRILYCIFIINISSLIIYAQPTLEWARRYNGPANEQDGASAVVVDRFGNVYVTGSSQTTTGIDYCTIKYNSMGDSVWVRRYIDGNYGGANDMAIDTAGNVYITGGLTIKYSNSGNLLWVAQNNGGCVRLIVDNSQNIYASGTGYDNYLTNKFDSDGNLLWRAIYNNPANNTDQIKDMALDPFGNIIVTGKSWGIGQTFYDYCTIKYNSQGDSLWVKRYNGPGPPNSSGDYAYAITSDFIGNIYVTGWSIGVNNNYNILTIKYNTVGDSAWVRRYPGSPSATGLDIKTDSYGNVFVLGVEAGYYKILKYNSDGNLINISLPIWGHGYASAGTPKIILDSNNCIYLTGSRYVNTVRSDILLVKFDNNLIEIWETQYHAGALSGDQNDPSDIALDRFGNIYIAGSGPGLPGHGADDITLKFSQVIGIIENHNRIPNSFNLHQSYPNPFNAETKIDFDLPKLTTLKLSIFDITGREVESLINESLSAGSYSIRWNGTNFTSGIYFCVMQSENFLQAIKLLLIK